MTASASILTEVAFYTLVLIAVGFWLYRKIRARLVLSRAKHPSLKGHAKISRWLAQHIPNVSYDSHSFFACDGAPETIVQQRREGMARLAQEIRSKNSQTLAHADHMVSPISDVDFVGRYKVPFTFSDELPAALKLPSIVKASANRKLCDLDDNWRYDLTGSYGTNVLGYDFYKASLARAFQQAQSLGPVLGPYHPVVLDNALRLKAISGLDEVSFHMSGTEAVMQAVRLARYHTRKTHLVRFCGAYHGWWDGVQPGIGNRRYPKDIYTLSDLSDATLKVLETRNDIACVIVNPMQAFHPNQDTGSDATLIAADRAVAFDKTTYSDWLRVLRDVCSRRNIVLIFDEVFSGFRLALKGAQAYFGVSADLVTYGKTLGGGLPVGVLCGKAHLMKRYRAERPVDISFARGTFNAHPYVMCAMNQFLLALERDDVQALYESAECQWTQAVDTMNQAFASERLPLKIQHMHSVLAITYTRPNRYSWMFQFYCRAAGLELSWIGSSRLIMSLDYTQADIEEITGRMIQAGQAMTADGWWWTDRAMDSKGIKRAFLWDIVMVKLPWLTPFIKRKASQQCRDDTPQSREVYR